MAHRDHQDRTAHPDQAARQAMMVHQVKQDDQHRAHQVFPANLAPQVTLDCRVRPVTTEHQVAMVNQAHPVPMVHPVHQDSPVIMDSQVHQEVPASQAHRANEVSVRNTAHWTVASSSRMAPDVDETQQQPTPIIIIIIPPGNQSSYNNSLLLILLSMIISESVVVVCSNNKKTVHLHTLRRVLYG